MKSFDGPCGALPTCVCGRRSLAVARRFGDAFGKAFWGSVDELGGAHALRAGPRRFGLDPATGRRHAAVAGCDRLRPPGWQPCRSLPLWPRRSRWKRWHEGPRLPVLLSGCAHRPAGALPDRLAVASPRAPAFRSSRRFRFRSLGALNRSRAKGATNGFLRLIRA